MEGKRNLLCFGLGLGLLIALAIGCQKDPSGVSKGENVDPLKDAPLFRVHPEEENLAFRFLNRETGKLETVMDMAQVPEEVQSAVVVMNLAPKGAVSPRALYVADLTQPKEDGSFALRVVDRFQYEKQAIPKTDRVPKKKSKVVMFSAEWCGVCKQAARWMKKEGIPFVERDVEKDSKAMGDLQKAARKAGMAPGAIAGSVPVFVAGGQILRGFDKAGLLKAIGR